MQIFLLLDQDTKPLKVYPLAGKGNKPVELINVGGVPQEVEKSFYAAALASYNLLMRSGDNIRHTIFAYELEGDTANRIYGGSGALAFAIVSMCEMLGTECKELIGATGTVDTETGAIGRVEAINDKLSSLLERLPEVRLVLYPALNDSELDPGIKRAAETRGFKLIPVRHLREARDILLGKAHGKGRAGNYAGKKNRALGVALILILLYLVYGFSSHLTALYLLENERYTIARWFLNFSRIGAFYNGNTRKIIRDFNTPIEAELVFTVRYSSGREETYLPDLVPPELKLHERDAFAFRMAPESPIYVYILQSDENGEYKRLFPQDENTAPIGSSVAIPGPGVFFRPQGKIGGKDILIVLSRWQCRKLEHFSSSHSRRGRLEERMLNYHLQEGSVQLHSISITLGKS